MIPVKTPRHRALQAKLHLAKAQMAMDDATYRAVLQRVTGKASSTDCTVAQLSSMLNECILKGWRPARAKNVGRRPVAPDVLGRISGGQIAKIEALLAAKGRQQGSPVPWAYAHALAQRLCKVDKVQWLSASQAGKVIAALEYDASRHASSAAEPGEGA